ncbi:TonB-linked outer membrane protein, SusC/RagA family [Mucilaginibacter lappiensis]|uniref:TonB-linked SusC/RagA family outer membrane protein n=1 Tax=Mucilaginibacter lappiensis TaxID=354630 RepID=A0ABR6PEQ7_9SPHI|nr:TonB-dependent receptor [Mucilaginibacter lappiensis]MBB6108088.1 TonB-linked SusC/RagA family outer membrane protein [Mucilaginibacter lappiensis]SIS11765.1 TonB-linked outer membrane protein, SusC/RagA family [Mucilaginibacter lappiensis]
MKRNLTISVLVLFCFFFVNTSFAQNAPVKGKVTDANTSEPLIGVSVAVKGTTTGTQTDVNGAFTIQAPPAATLVFTYIGYTTLSLSVNNQSTLTVKLQPESKELQQVVVIGYGTQKKRDVTGAVASVNGDLLAKQPVQTATQALQGKVSGVQVLSSGQPNSAPILRIRGTGSVLAGANPLYVVDGVLTDDIRNINTNDILSLDVLKDASAAIYGVRGANGVVIITTKKGKSGPATVSYDATVGFRQVANPLQLANRAQYTDYLKDANPTADVNAPVTFPGTTDWLKVVSRTAFTTNHNVSVAGGGETNTYFISANYLDDQGVIKTNGFQRFTIRANNEINISKKLKFSEQISLSRGAEQTVNLNGIYGNIYRAAPIIPSIVDGKYGNTSAWGNVGNPLLQLDKANNFTLNNRVQGNVALDYKPISSLTFHSAFNTDVRFNNQKNYQYQFLADNSTFTVGGGNQYQNNSVLFVQNDDSYQYTWDNTVTFDKTFGKHHLTVLGGFVTEKNKSNFLNGSRQDVPANQDQWYLSLGNPDVNAKDDNGGGLFTRQSFVSRVNYGFEGKYLLSGSFRRDGSSKFNQHWGNFYTFGGGWVISEESFMKDNHLFDQLKLRASYGKLGNDNIDQALYIVTATSNLPYYFNNTLNLGSVIQDIKDLNLKWETTTQFDIGLDFAILNNRLSGEVDYYNKKVADALTKIPLPGILGDPDNTYITNAASYSNKGIELGLKWNDRINSKLSYSIGANISYNKNNVIGLNGGQALYDGGINSNTVTRTDNGQPIGSYYVLQATGVFQTAAEAATAPTNTFEANKVGGLKYADINHDGKIDANDRVYAGSYQPKYYGGFNFAINYTHFDLSADFTGNWGNKIYNGKKNSRGSENDNIEASYADSRFTTAKPSNTNPNVITASTPPSTYFIESGAYMRLNNLTLGYTLPSAMLKRANISKLRIFLTSQNLFTLKRYSGSSPELFNNDVNTGITAAGIDNTNYPVTRTFALGLNLQF